MPSSTDETSEKSTDNPINNVSILKTLILLFAASATFFFISCKTCPPVQDTEYFYRLVNCSGHTISIVHDPACIELPDSLVLKEEMEFGFVRDWSSSGIRFFWYLDKPDRRRILYFDGRYALNFLELLEERKFFIPARYEKQAPFDYRFTFTVEDYDYAVEHGRDLGDR